MQFVADLEPDADGSLQIMYGIDGRRDLSRVRSVTIVRIRRRSARSHRERRLQPDARMTSLARVLDCIHAHTSSSSVYPATMAHCRRLKRRAHQRCGNRRTKASGKRGVQPQHYVSSKLMCWVALDRAAKACASCEGNDAAGKYLGCYRPGDSRPTSAARESVNSGVLRQHYDTDALGCVGACSPHSSDSSGGADPRLRATVEAVESELTPATALCSVTEPMKPTMGCTARRARSSSVRSGWYPRSPSLVSMSGPTTSWSGCCPSHHRWVCTPRSTR